MDGETSDSVTQHTVTIGGKAIAYAARAGTITLRTENDEPTARVFYTAYTVEDEPGRPVTFLYNGGPGSSTMWLRMGSVGPVRVQAGDGKPSGPPPYRIGDNPYSILDKTDLVFIDMPDSGFGRIVGAGNPKMFFGVDQDVAAFGQFIERYITTFHRWNSPKFIFGESYGTTRSAALVDYLQNHGIPLNGVVLQSSILNYGLDFSNGDPIAAGDWPYVLYLPTEAATAWYHGKIRNKPADLAEFVAQVEQFALGDYLNALYQGGRLSSAQRNRVANQPEPISRRAAQLRADLELARPVLALSARAPATRRVGRRPARLTIHDVFAGPRNGGRAAVGSHRFVNRRPVYDGGQRVSAR